MQVSEQRFINSTKIKGNISRGIVVILFSIILLLVSSPYNAVMAENAYGLKVGEKAPDMTADDVDGNTFDLYRSLESGPVVLVFYLGRWYPYSADQLSELQDKIAKVADKYNAKIVAVSVDKRAEAKKIKRDESLSFTIISDPDTKASTDFKVVQRLTDEVVERYLMVYEIDVEAASGKKHHMVAQPAVFVIDTTGTIVYTYSNKDYKVRANVKEIRRALMKAASMQKHN
ncbi:peroxiredoxin family protein [Thermodesulfobacteriota bacterium]